MGQPAQVARQPIPTPTSTDWCASLVFGTGTAITAFVFPHDTLSVSNGELRYNADGSYQSVINTVGPGTIDLSRACLTRSGTALSCAELAASLTSFAGQMRTMPGEFCSDSPSDPVTCQYYYSFQNIDCQDGAEGGCRCTYNVSFAGTYQGRWVTQGNMLNHFGQLTAQDTPSLLPSQSDYCVDGTGATMTLWGHNRTPILGVPGLLTLTLQKAP